MTIQTYHTAVGVEWFELRDAGDIEVAITQYMSISDAIIWQRSKDSRYEFDDDETVLLDFIAINWATLLDKDDKVIPVQR